MCPLLCAAHGNKNGFCAELDIPASSGAFLTDSLVFSVPQGSCLGSKGSLCRACDKVGGSRLGDKPRLSGCYCQRCHFAALCNDVFLLFS